MRINAERLKRAIDERMLARREVAEALGVSQQSVARWLAGNANPKTEHFRRLADLLKINPKQLTKQTKQNER